jgi:hypothetical protein
MKLPVTENFTVNCLSIASLSVYIKPTSNKLLTNTTPKVPVPSVKIILQDLPIRPRGNPYGQFYGTGPRKNKQVR